MIEESENILRLKKELLKDPNHILFVTRSIEGYALGKVALQTDKLINRLRFRARPANKEQWAKTAGVMDQISEMVEKFKGAVAEMTEYRDTVRITNNVIENEEEAIKSIYSFVTVPRTTAGKSLFPLICRIDDIIFSYRSKHEVWESVAKATDIANDALRKLNDYTAEIAGICNVDYKPAHVVRKLLDLEDGNGTRADKEITQEAKLDEGVHVEEKPETSKKGGRKKVQVTEDTGMSQQEDATL